MKFKNSYTSTPAFLSPKSQAEAERLKHFADMVYMNCATTLSLGTKNNSPSTKE